MSDFFKKKNTVDVHCKDCLVYKKGQRDSKGPELMAKKGNGDVLVVTPYLMYETGLKWFQKELEKKGIKDYVIVSGTKCDTIMDSITPAHQPYKICKTISEGKYNPKVIITVGKGLKAIAVTDDLPSWREFCETKFNQTYFYTGYDWKEKIRVYPIPVFGEWRGQDNFENWFVMKQFANVSEFLKSPEEFNYIEPKKVIVDNPDEFLEKHMGEKEVAWDTETSGVRHFDDDFKVKCITMSFDGITGYYLPFDKINKRLLSKFFRSKKQITAEGKFDTKTLYTQGISTCKVDEDIIILYHLFNTDRMRNGLKSLAWLIGCGGYDEELDIYRKKSRVESFYDIPEDILSDYAIMDAIVTYRLYKNAVENLVPKQPKIYEVYKNTTIPVIPVFEKMEINGMEVDADYLNTLNADLEQELEGIKFKIKDEFGDIDINSPKQLARALEESGYPCLGVGKETYQAKNEYGELETKNYYSTGVDCLVRWKRMGYKIMEDLLRYRALSKLKSTYVGEYSKKEKKFFDKKNTEKEKKVKGIVKFIQSDGKIHSTFRPAATDAYRSSSRDPNLQNQTKQVEYSDRVRAIFKCPDDYVFFEADYAGFHLRIVAGYTQDDTMLDIFLTKGGDIHSMTANAVFCRDKSFEEFISLRKEKPYSSYRFKAKAINFGFIYGMLAYTFKRTIEDEWEEVEVHEYIRDNKLEIKEDRNTGELDYTFTVAEDIRNKFFQRYPKLMPWIKKTHGFAQYNAYTDTFHGIRRHLPIFQYVTPDILKYNKDIRGAFNVAVNHPVLAFEAEEMYRALIKVDSEIRKRGLKSKLVACVHDSAVGYCHKSEIKEMYHLLKDCMEFEWQGVPFVIDVAMGNVWGFGKEIDESNIDKFIENNK